MGKYFKLFQKHSNYETAQSNLLTPNVSYCENQNHVHFNPIPDPYNGHAYVDLGLPSGTKWATMNVGASSITDYGNYYQYGKGADTYQVTSGDSVYDTAENPLATSADTAAQVWGGQWHMPTREQLSELTGKTAYQWVTDYQGSGINGGTFTANGHTLFIPAASYYYNGSLKDIVGGDILSSKPYTVNGAYLLSFDDGGVEVKYGYNRNLGFSIRPVAD